jgi:hypothetical protein
VRDSGDGIEQADIDLSERQRAVAKPRRMRPELALDLRATAPPPAQDVDDVAVGREQRRVGRGVMPVPRLRLLHLHLSNRGNIGVLRRRFEREDDPQNQ